MHEASTTAFTTWPADLVEARECELPSQPVSATWEILRALVNVCIKALPTTISMSQMPDYSIGDHAALELQCQVTEESFAEFVAELRHIAEHCEFGGTSEKMLCNCLASSKWSFTSHKSSSRVLSMGLMGTSKLLIS